MAEQFILTTGGWSEYFLNDTPSSRRPWLFRKEYNTIDELLKKYEELTYYAERRHPEEFASAFNQRMRGSWNLPRRNPNFTGRGDQLDQLRLRLVNQDDDDDDDGGKKKRRQQQRRVVVRDNHRLLFPTTIWTAHDLISAEENDKISEHIVQSKVNGKGAEHI